MKIEQQVCTLGQAKRLQEFGVGQQSEFRWTRWANRPFGIYRFESCSIPLKGYEFAAYTVAELDRAMMIDYAGNLMPSLLEYHDWMDEQHINHKSSASLKAALLIHFLEEKVFTADQVNNRLNA